MFFGILHFCFISRFLSLSQDESWTLIKNKKAKTPVNEREEGCFKIYARDGYFIQSRAKLVMRNRIDLYYFQGDARIYNNIMRERKKCKPANY